MPHQCTNCGRRFPDGSKEMLSGCPDCGGNKFQFHPGGTGESAPPDDASSRSSSDSSRRPASDAPSTDRQTPANSSDRTAGSPTDSSASSSSSPRSASPDRSEGARRSSSPNSSAAGTDSPAGGSKPSTEPSETEPSETEPSTRRDTDAEDTAQADAEGTAPPDAEDTAQADARRDVVSRDELASVAEESTPSHPPEDVDGRVIEPTDEDRPDLDELREQLNDQFESIRIVSPGQYELNLMELYDRQEYIISLQEDGKYVIDVPDAWRSAGDE